MVSIRAKIVWGESIMSKDERVYRQEDIEKIIASRLKEHHLAVSKETAKVVIDTLWDVLYDALVEGYTVKLHGKGQFYLSKRSARMGRNPRTGITYDIPEREIMAFKVSDALSKRLRKERHKKAHT